VDVECEAFVQALRDGDPQAAQRACEAAAAAAPSADVATLTRAAEALGGAVADLPAGRAGVPAPLLGSLVSVGADPGVLAPLVDRAVRELRAAGRFLELWSSTGAGDPDDGEGPLDELPDPDQPDDAAVARLVSTLRSRAVSDGATDDQLRDLARTWFTTGPFVQGLLIPLQRKDVRAVLPGRAALVEAVADAPDAPNASWLAGLLAVLDDEPLVVLHRASSRGFRLTISGVADNFQLHTLLASVVIGDPARGLVDGTPPESQWVRSATDGPPSGGAVKGRFNLVDAYGAWIWNEGTPAGIPLLDGVRVVVLDPPPYERTWSDGRGYPEMVASVRLDEVMPTGEAADWLARVAPPSSPFGQPGA
jgi:hypothetical protein